MIRVDRRRCRSRTVDRHVVGDVEIAGYVCVVAGATKRVVAGEHRDRVRIGGGVCIRDRLAQAYGPLLFALVTLKFAAGAEPALISATTAANKAIRHERGAGRVMSAW